MRINLRFYFVVFSLMITGAVAGLAIASVPYWLLTLGEEPHAAIDFYPIAFALLGLCAGGALGLQFGCVVAEKLFPQARDNDERRR